MFDKEDIKCNLCGLSCMLGTDDPFRGSHGLLNIEVIGGYDSTPGNGYGTLGDMSGYKFSFCEYCLDWIFKQCKVPIAVRDVCSNTPEPWRPAGQRVLEDEWRKDKTTFFEEEAKHNAARSS